jgi:hypothetical protein
MLVSTSTRWTHGMENTAEVLSGLVLKRIRDGRCRYDPQVKQELVTRCLQPGVSVARMAMQHGVNANLLRSGSPSSKAATPSPCNKRHLRRHHKTHLRSWKCNSPVRRMHGWRCRNKQELKAAIWRQSIHIKTVILCALPHRPVSLTAQTLLSGH